MFNYSNASISNISIHGIGNKLKEEGLVLSKEEYPLQNKLQKVLVSFFLSAFKTIAYSEFFDPNDLKYNVVYSCVSDAFDNESEFNEKSKQIAKHLYGSSEHHQIKSGDLFVVKFQNCFLDGQVLDSIGIFKLEDKSEFIDIKNKENRLTLDYFTGFDLSDLDKGCIIFNCEKESGFKVLSITSQKDVKYWNDTFLSITPSNDSYHSTSNFLKLTKEFISKEIPSEYEIGRADQADMLNRSISYFKEKDDYKRDEFENDVFKDPQVIDSFHRFYDRKSKEDETELPENFSISEMAVKKNARIFKSVLKLDKNFHVYIHGNRELIEKGFDSETGKKYYKIYFDEEN